MFQLHEAVCFTSQLTDMGDEQFVQIITAFLADQLEPHEGGTMPPLGPTPCEGARGLAMPLVDEPTEHRHDEDLRDHHQV